MLLLIIKSKFKAARWLTNPHMQTIWASKLRRIEPPVGIIERLELPDGDFLDIVLSQSLGTGSGVDEAGNTVVQNTGIVCLFHGLGGSIKSAYASATFRSLERAGFAVAFMHYRGCSGEPNRLAKAYHSGQTEDIRYFINYLANRFPQASLHACAFSLGANALLKYLGEETHDCPLESAIAVAPPLVLEEGAKKLNQGFARIYQRYLLNEMKRQFHDKKARYPQLELPNDTEGLDNFWLFDDAITAKVHGFRDVHDYYRQSGSRQYLKSIQCPTHIIHSLDDPFFTPAVVPVEDELSKAVTLELSDQGGHVGFVAGSNPCAPEYWLDDRIPLLLMASE